MSVTKKLGKGTVHMVKDDLTDMAVDSFVFYAKPDLKLGTGYGNAVAVRGGPTIQDELKAYGNLNVGEAVVMPRNHRHQRLFGVHRVRSC